MVERYWCGSRGGELDGAAGAGNIHVGFCDSEPAGPKHLYRCVLRRSRIQLGRCSGEISRVSSGSTLHGEVPDGYR